MGCLRNSPQGACQSRKSSGTSPGQGQSEFLGQKSP
jgi:hypothetical protein